MNCDRAQEQFSDYLEGNLSVSAFADLERHLQACEACRDDVEGVRFTCAMLARVPEAIPPADGEWEVIRRLRENRRLQEPASRRRGLLAWLRVQSPLAVGSTAALATLVIGGLFLASNSPDHIQSGVAPRFQTPTRPDAVGAPAPDLTVRYGALTPEGQEVHFRITPAGTVTSGRVTLSSDGQVRLDETITGNLNPGRPLELTVPLAVGGEQAATVRLELTARELQYGRTVIVPLGPARTGPVTLSLVDQPAEAVLRSLAPALGRPVIVTGVGLDQKATLQVAGSTAPDALRLLAGSLGAEVKSSGGMHFLTGAAR